jgi:hypothetical protein
LRKENGIDYEPSSQEELNKQGWCAQICCFASSALFTFNFWDIPDPLAHLRLKGTSMLKACFTIAIPTK